ncbi:MAG: UpxY family transcription antiterminator [Deltaproteobacteria bacterium]|nr:UpxY family transcription antiterminator [Deltaproteobacteria bacterium]
MTPAPDSPPTGLLWYAVHTQSRHERKVENKLVHHGLACWLAEYACWSKRKDRRKRIRRPLFSGYLFVQTRMTAQIRLQIIQAPSVVRIVGVGHRPVAIPNQEIESLQRLLSTAPEAEPHPAMRKGQLVQVMEGPLSGVIGRVMTEARGKKIVVTVDLLGRAVAASLETDAVVPYLDQDT